MTGTDGLAGELQLRFPHRYGQHYWIGHALAKHPGQDADPRAGTAVDAPRCRRLRAGPGQGRQGAA
ncbi:hypothetical protein GCM10010507_19830 [Streptomyces cinnamoneus]|uniref:Uncharacterized protein n=2 Tax=Streptomyces cinnamoneus TaxID=53446 RepID=A0A918TE53_STRCJ|nr:hypothetical protein GCM10010507_19830 [Streptomyces cinnamoneus]